MELSQDYKEDEEFGAQYETLTKPIHRNSTLSHYHDKLSVREERLVWVSSTIITQFILQVTEESQRLEEELSRLSTG